MWKRLHISTRCSWRILIKLKIFKIIFEKKVQIWSLIKIRPVGTSCSMWTYGWIDRHDKAYSRFSQFCEGAKKRNFHHYKNQRQTFRRGAAFSGAKTAVLVVVQCTLSSFGYPAKKYETKTIVIRYPGKVRVLCYYSCYKPYSISF